MKERLELLEREGKRAEEQRGAAVADYEREVARHAEKLTALSEARDALSAANAKLAGLEGAQKSWETEKARLSEQWTEEKRGLVREREEALERHRELEQHVALLQKHLDREAASKAAAAAAQAGGGGGGGGASGGGGDGVVAGSEGDVVELTQQLGRLKQRKDLAEARLLDAEQVGCRPSRHILFIGGLRFAARRSERVLNHSRPHLHFPFLRMQRVFG